MDPIGDICRVLWMPGISEHRSWKFHLSNVEAKINFAKFACSEDVWKHEPGLYQVDLKAMRTG